MALFQPVSTDVERKAVSGLFDIGRCKYYTFCATESTLCPTNHPLAIYLELQPKYKCSVWL